MTMTKISSENAYNCVTIKLKVKNLDLELPPIRRKRSKILRQHDPS